MKGKEMGTIKDYRNMVEQPWGRMFYDLIYRQLAITNDRRVKILDFGAGFCITTNHYAQNHDVTALEPNREMCELKEVYGLRTFFGLSSNNDIKFSEE